MRLLDRKSSMSLTSCEVMERDETSNTAATHCLFVMGTEVIELPPKMTDSVLTFWGQELIRLSHGEIMYCYLHSIIWVT